MRWKITIEALDEFSGRDTVEMVIEKDFGRLSKGEIGLTSPVKMSQFDHVASHVTATMSAAVSASDAAMITKAIVSAA